jgi:hypothetical protein
MQASRQNTRQLGTLQTETLEWYTRGDQWSIVNYGPATLWFNYSGSAAAPGAVNSTRLQAGFSFTDNVSAPRYMEISLAAEGPLTYCLDTNQRLPAAYAGIEEAPQDGQVYGRRNGVWMRAAGVPQTFPAAGGWFLAQLAYRTLHFGDQLEVFGELRRLTGNEVQPGAWVPVGTLPADVRPLSSIQYRIALGAPVTPNQFSNVALRLQSNGLLEVLVPQATLAFYFNEIFDLTLFIAFKNAFQVFEEQMIELKTKDKSLWTRMLGRLKETVATES